MLLALRGFVAVGIVGIGVFFWITSPVKVDPQTYAGLTANPENGKMVFWAAGCASCHTEPGSDATDAPSLSGGQAFASDFGTFYAPNISPDPDHGIGGWTVEEFANAVQKGVSPTGQHYYPAFPYSAYNKMQAQDLVDLKAFFDTLPADQTESKAHDVGFPFNIRRNLGGWKFLFVSDEWVLDTAPTPELERGRYLVEALAHCGECHTPRNALGGLETSSWLEGAPVPGGKGRVPAISPGKLNWTAEDIAYYLETGFTPDFDSVGGHMAAVVENMSRLTESDRKSVAAYLKAIPDE
ncbi:cytochrome c [Actibacterium pelagium]|uniref:Diheme cytochrome c-type n=1 Tax=Actibacterium pelagium TaxID=2029103 RepID=A0A917ACB8_9RHOB|nr:cytochrome c [Actibacterium pelagium]GGE42989.1 diheme cytochrome c-type [Actibacterium pelagium]